MKCPKCQFDNREGAKFCKKCGTELSRKCPQCGADIDLEDSFCDECGYNLTFPPEPVPQAVSFEEKLDKVQHDLPDGLTEKILAQRDTIEGERKQVTVMFCDIAGFASLSDRLRPDEVYSIMDELCEILIHRVHSYGGTVNKATGMMALFGAPIAIEDAPQRAIRAAISIHQEVARFNERMRHQRGIPPINMRIGIHTGPVVVNKLGDDLRVELATEGDTVDLASRMQELAKPGTTYVTEDTFKLTQDYFRFEAIGERETKAYRVIIPSTIRSRFDVSAERGLTPFIGRERELELLLDSFERARAGKGQAFSLMGEAGIGKSRLLYEFRKAIAHHDVTFLEGRCLSHGRNIAYHPIIDTFKANFDVREGDKDNQIRDKVRKGLKETGVNEATTLPYILELLSVKDSGIDKIPMSGEARRDRMMEAWKQLVLKISEKRPLIVTIEDLHWADQSSEEALKYLLDSISEARLLLIFTYRPEFVHSWGSRSYHNQLNLNRLSNRESLSMATYLLDTEEIEPGLEDLILEKTEGIPFFIEELIRSLKDLEAIQRKDGTCCLNKDIQEVSIPGTIQGIIMGRVDALPDAAKGVLQTGAVIEREFSYDLIKQVAGMSEQDLLPQLSLLKDAELIYERGVFPQSEYIFRHALTREVVYDSITDIRKKKLHVAIGNAIQESNKDNPDDYYEVLAGHYVTAEDYGKGAEYCRLAAGKAEAVGSLNDAIAYSEKGLACLERLPRKEDLERKIIDIRTSLGLYYLHVAHLAEARAVVEPVVDLAEKLDYKSRVSQIYTILGHCAYHLEEDYPGAFKYLEDALKIAEEMGDIPSLATVHQWLGNGLIFACDFQKGLYHMEKALEINVAANNLWGMAAIKALISLQDCYWGKVDQGYKTGAEAVSTAEESGDVFSKAMAYSMYGNCCSYKGLFEEAEEYLLKGADLAERTNNYVPGLGANWVLAEIYSLRAEYQKAQEYSQKALLIAERSSGRCFTNFTMIVLARGKVMNNQQDIDLEEIFKLYEENRTNLFEGNMARYIADILLNIDDEHMDEAEEWIKKAIEADKRNGMMWHLGHDYALYGELLKRKGDLPGARDNLKNAIKIYKGCGADGWVKKAEEELAKIQV